MARIAQPSAKSSPAFMLFSPKRGRILSGSAQPGALRERAEGAPAHLVDLSLAGDLAVLGRAGIAGGRPLAVVVDQRPRLRPVDLEPLLHGLLAVVVALPERLARDV